MRWLLVIAALLLGAWHGGTPLPAYSPTMAGQITLSGTTWERDGVGSWTAKGLVTIGRLVPSTAVGSGKYGTPYITARQNFGLGVLRAIKGFGADTVAIKISIMGLDPASAYYDPTYPGEIITATKQARQIGMSVILCLVPNTAAGDSGYPDSHVQAAWNTLLTAPGFPLTDKGIMLELLNEPSWNDSDSNWPTWQADYNAVIGTVRGDGAQQIVMADGTQNGRYLNNAPALTDSMNNYAYAVHPYPASGSFLLPAGTTYWHTTDWDAFFGNFCAAHACMATEWSTTSLAGCVSTQDVSQIAQSLLTYLRGKDIGSVGWAYDYPSTIISATSGVPTDFQSYTSGSCAAGAWGNGILFRQMFNAVWP